MTYQKLNKLIKYNYIFAKIFKKNLINILTLYSFKNIYLIYSIKKLKYVIFLFIKKIIFNLEIIILNIRYLFIIQYYLNIKLFNFIYILNKIYNLYYKIYINTYLVLYNKLWNNIYNLQFKYKYIFFLKYIFVNQITFIKKNFKILYSIFFFISDILYIKKINKYFFLKKKYLFNLNMLEYYKKLINIKFFIKNIYLNLNIYFNKQHILKNKKEYITVLRAPHIDKRSREQFLSIHYKTILFIPSIFDNYFISNIIFLFEIQQNILIDNFTIQKIIL